jgi:hypothetical protein
VRHPMYVGTLTHRSLRVRRSGESDAVAEQWEIQWGFGDGTY